VFFGKLNKKEREMENFPKKKENFSSSIDYP